MKYPLMLTAVLALLLSAGLRTSYADQPKQPNVLFIAIDDLNHWVGHLGRHPQTKTPHIDGLYEQGTTFTRAYCTAPSCNPSRASLMSGMRPSTTGCYGNDQNWRQGISSDQLLNTHFLKAGYNVYGAGKIYHGAFGPGGEWTDYFMGKEKLRRHPTAKNDGVGGIRFYPVSNSDEEMADYQAVSYGLEKLQEKSDKPFFLAIGIIKPHMPFSVPKKYFDKFSLETIQLPPHLKDDLQDVPPAGVQMARPEGDHAQMVASGRWKEAVQAYLATIAFADAQVGRLLEGLENSPHKDNTIVCLWSDHGWSLGEKSHWRKFALWEEPTRTVFIWKVPGLTKANQKCERTVDFSCIYPTLCELTNLPQPEHLDGRSIVPLLKDPQANWQYPAITTNKFQNHAIRSEGWRYIRYANGDEELYDEAADPLEYKNLAKSAEHAEQISQLKKWLPQKNANEMENDRYKNKKKPQA